MEKAKVKTTAGAEIELEKELSMSVSPWAWRLRLTLTPPAAGTYLIVCDWNQEPYGLAMHRVEVAGQVTPPPPPPPPPDRVADQVTIVVESQDQMTAEQIEIVNGQEVRAAAQAAGQTFRAVDRDVTGPDAAHVQHAIAASKNEPLPRVVFSKAGQVIAQAPLPATVAAMVELIRQGGKRP
jgi:hypothetical protein